ncbi:amidase [Rhizobium sp.]|jgi:Asp-tRNA(Asn)/Glu-tRNA(Gln) amidotransferase A subunit family amidase|uniref:amidase n=1 Tax=Rhizobium sp. TaxID=391 RepID=UPI000E7ED967|nr:amidase [Rhizobium sp.]
MDQPVSTQESLNTLTASEAIAALRRGDITASALVSACLEQISRRDGDVKAWLCVNPDALKQAEMLDHLPKGQRGLLHGLPLAIKDVFETFDLPTTHNSPLFQGFRPALDAASVDLLRAEGAIILGKTDTTEFAAAGRNAATGNPHNLSHTSGGSSAGSAAAVADFHVPLALATQTGGSTIRPASFCGVYGFKPSFGLVSREGVKIYANSLDTVGWYGRSVADIALLAEVFGITESIRPLPDGSALNIAVSFGPYREKLAVESVQAVEITANRLRAGGHHVESIDFPEEFEGLHRVHRTIMYREGAAAFRNLAKRFGAELHDDFHHRVDNRDASSLADLGIAYDFAASARMTFDAIAASYDVVIVPSAPGFAPEGRAPGDPVFNAMWTLLGVPCLNVPVGLRDNDLPIGVTLTAPRFSDLSLLSCAEMIAKLIEPI